MRIELRAPLEGDLERVVELQNEARTEVGDAPTQTLALLRSDWRSPLFDPQRDARVAVVGAAVAGFVLLWNRRRFVFADGSVARAWRRRGVGTALMAWALEAARAQRFTELHAYAPTSRPDALAFLTSCPGFEHVRTFYWMLHRAPDDVPGPQWPQGIALVGLEGEELARATAAAHDASFLDHWNFTEASVEELLHWIVEDGDPELWMVAKSGEHLAGFCICYLEGDGEQRHGVVAELGTTRAFRGIGLGRALLQEALRRCAARGARRVGLGVDAENPTGALALYRSAGFEVERENKRFRVKL